MQSLYSIPDESKFRNNIKELLRKNLDNTKSTSIIDNLEKAIKNRSIEIADNEKLIKRFDNSMFVVIYKNILRTILYNLKNNPDLKNKILNKEIKAHKLAYMTHQEMQPKRWEQLIADKKIKDENRYRPKLEASTDNFTCWKCKSKKCSYYQLQTRSADEPMTTFVTCLECGNRWKC